MLLKKDKERFITKEMILGSWEYIIKGNNCLKIELLFLEKSKNKLGLFTYVIVVMELLNKEE